MENLETLESYLSSGATHSSRSTSPSVSERKSPYVFLFSEHDSYTHLTGYWNNACKEHGISKPWLDFALIWKFI